MTDHPSPCSSPVHGPADLKRLSAEDLTRLAAEIRQFLVDKVTTTGGHLGPNLGVVELTMADPPGVRLPDATRSSSTSGTRPTSTRCVTGRRRRVRPLRRQSGLSGYPSRAESEHDLVENSHASTGAVLRGRAGEGVRSCAASGGTSSRSSGTARSPAACAGRRSTTSRPGTTGRWSSSSTTTAARTRRRSAGSPTTSRRCGCSPGYERALEGGKRMLQGTPVVGKPLYAALHAAKRGIKDALSPQVMFEDLGLKYFGPVDGHDFAALEAALRRAKEFGGPVIVHAATCKGRGLRAGGERRSRPDAPDRPDRPGHRQADDGEGRDVDVGVRATRWCASASERAGRRRDHRGDAALGRAREVRRGVPGPLVRRRHRRAARGHVGRGHGDGGPAPGRRASTRRSSTAPSTRC